MSSIMACSHSEEQLAEELTAVVISSRTLLLAPHFPASDARLLMEWEVKAILPSVLSLLSRSSLTCGRRAHNHLLPGPPLLLPAARL